MKLIKYLYMFIGIVLILLGGFLPQILHIHTPTSRWGVCIIGCFMFIVAYYSIYYQDYNNEN